MAFNYGAWRAETCNETIFSNSTFIFESESEKVMKVVKLACNYEIRNMIFLCEEIITNDISNKFFTSNYSHQGLSLFVVQDV